MGHRSISTRIAKLLLVLVAASGAVVGQPNSEITWKVASTFPQRAEIVNGEHRWRNPANALSKPGESFDHWYKRLAAENRSPYADFIGTSIDAWNEADQQYRPEFLSYIRGDFVEIVIEVKGPLAAAESCTWTIDGIVVSNQARCAFLEWRVPTRKVLVHVKANPVSDLSALGDSQSFAMGYVHPKRLVILGLGDSYASGEGNPDIPTLWKDDVISEGRRLEWLKFSGKNNKYVREGALWRDTTCHRSYWNQQNIAAARLAAANPQQEVVFLQFACSGAEIFDGMLVRQVNPPGIAENKLGCSRATDPKCRLKMSQMRAAVSALCKGDPERADSLIATMDKSIKEASRDDGLEKMDAYRLVPKDMRIAGEDFPSSALDLVQCSDLVKPDAILMLVGGNDAGFAQLVAWALMPRRGANVALDIPYRLIRRYQVVCPPAQKEWCRGATSDTLAIQLPFRYRWLAATVQAVGMELPPGRILVTSYPDALRMDRGVITANSNLCGDDYTSEQKKAEKNSWNNQWAAFNVAIPNLLRYRRPWRFSLNATASSEKSWRLSPGHELIMRVLPDLRRSLQASVVEARFTYVDTSDAFIGRGWCSETRNRIKNMPLPDPDNPWNNLTPYNWRPFEPRNRLVRTANDSYLTQLSKRSGDVNGTMHPTAEGHFKLAEQLHDRLASSLQSGL